jgi:transcription antitermination protein NusB
MTDSQQVRPSTRARSVARRLAMQAIYQAQLNAQPWQDLHQQFMSNDDMPRADGEYFRELVQQVCGSREVLDADLASLVDRPLKDLDPVEHAILLIGLYELKVRNDVPFRVVINEGVGLAKKFGATDGHKYVNAVLDRAAAQLRADERGSRTN